MPLRWVEPELFIEYAGISIYHTYKSGDFNDRSEHWYTTSLIEEEGFEFDIRDIKEKLKVEEDDHTIILINAIDKKELKLPSRISYRD